MDAIMSNIRDIIPFCIFAWGILALGVFRGPQRFRNCFLLLIALFFTGLLICGLFGNHMGDALIVLAIATFLAVLAVPFVFIANGLIMLRREGRSLANLLSLILGALVLFGEVAALMAVLSVSPDGSARTLYATELLVAISVFYFCMVFLAFMLYSVFIQHIPHNCAFEYIIVHGCGLLQGHRVSKLLANRLDAAIALYRSCEKTGAAPRLILSGGKGSDEDVSEAQAMADYAREHGIPADRLILEDRSATTLENLQNSAQIINGLDAQNRSAAVSDTLAATVAQSIQPAPAPRKSTAKERRQGRRRIALVTSNYHVYRCLRLARRIGLPCTGIGGKVAPYYWPSAIIREFAAVFSEKKMLVLILLGWLFFASPFIMLLFAA